MNKGTAATQLTLPLGDEMITIHCFFHCKHVVQSVDPREAHDLMEQHYSEKHSRHIERIYGMNSRKG